jgi:hypothetical protein
MILIFGQEKCSFKVDRRLRACKCTKHLLILHPMTGDLIVVLSGKRAALSIAITINWAVCLLLLGMCKKREAGISMVATISYNIT